MQREHGGGSVLSAQSRYLSAGCILLGYRRRKQPWPGLFAPRRHPAALDGWAVNPYRQHTHTQLDYTHMYLHLHSHEVCVCVCEVLIEIYIKNVIAVAALLLPQCDSCSVFDCSGQMIKKRKVRNSLALSFIWCLPGLKLHPITLLCTKWLSHYFLHWQHWNWTLIVYRWIV